MKYIILSISVFWLSISGITGNSLSKVQLKKPSDLVYKIKEDKDGATLLITSPKLEQPTLREIIYYHIIERPYKKKWLNEDSSNEDQRAFEDVRRVFTNGPGFQYGRVKQTEPSSTDKKNEKIPINDGTHQIDIRHGDLDAKSNTDQGNIDFPQESQENKDNVTSKRRKRDIRYETSVSKRDKRENNIQRVTGLSDLPSTLYMNKQPAFTNIPNSIDDMSLTPNKDENQRVNGIVPRPTRPYGMDFTGSNGNYWNNFNDPYNVFRFDGDQGLDPKVHRPAEPISYHPEANAINSSPNLGIKKDTNGFPDRNSNPIGPKDQGGYLGNSQGSRSPGYGLHPNSRESDDGGDSGERSDESSRESGSWSSEDSGNRSGEDSGTRSCEDSGSSSREDSSSSERGYEKDSCVYGKRDSQEHKDSGRSKESDNKGNNDSYTDHKQETKKKFDQILSDLHKIFVQGNATVIVPSNPGLVGSKDAVNDGAVNNDTKKANMISVLEGLFTNIIRNTIIVNNNVPVIQNPNPIQNDASNPNIPQKFHDTVDTTTNSEGITPASELNSFKDTTDNPINKTEDFKPVETRPEFENGTDTKNVGRPDEVTTFNVTKVHNNTDKELNKNKTSVQDKNNDKLPSSTEKPNEDKGNSNKDGDKSNKTADEKKTNTDEGDGSKKYVNVTETPGPGLKDNDISANNKDNKDPSGMNQNLDKMVDLMNNEKFWKFMGDLSAKYLETLVERTTKIMKEEISAQIENHFKDDKPEAVNKEIQPKKDEIPNKKQNKSENDLDKANNVIEDTNEANTTENPVTNKEDARDNNQKDKDNKKDSENIKRPEANKDDGKEKKDEHKDIVKVKSHNIYGNTVGNEKVTNIYVFYASRNLGAIMKNIKDLVLGNNNTNIFNFEPLSNKNHHQDEDKHSNGKHKGNEPEITENKQTNVTDKNGNTVTEPDREDTVTTKKPFTNKDNDKNTNMNTTKSNVTDTVTESTIEHPVTTDFNMSSNTTDSSTNSTPKIEASTRPNDVTTEITQSTSGTDITIDPKKEEITTENAKHETSTGINTVTDKASNDVTSSKVTTPNTPTAEINNGTAGAVTTESSIEKDNKNVTGKGENKRTDANATKGINSEVTTEPTRGDDIINGTTNPSTDTNVSTENPINKTTTEIPNKGTSNITDKVESSTTQIDVSTTKPNVTENKPEKVLEPSGNLSSLNVTASNSSDVSAGNSTENPKTENTNINNKNITDVIDKPETSKNLTQNDKSENNTKITSEKGISLNKTSNSNEIDTHKNETTESPSIESSTEKTANSTENKADRKNTSTDLKPGNNTNSIENAKNETNENATSEKKNATVTSENHSDKSGDEHKDENLKDKSEDKKANSEENKDNKKTKSENESTTGSSVDKDISTKKSLDEANIEKKNS